MEFPKLDVSSSTQQQGPSLLFSSLASSLSPEPRSRERGGGGGGVKSSGRDSPTSLTVQGYTVGEAIAAIVETYTTRERASGERDGPTTPPPLPPSHYSLLVAEEDGTIVDPDFPEIDPSVSITTVGVDKFILVQRGGVSGGEEDTILLRVTIPATSIAVRACELGAPGAPQLTLTCYLPHSPGAKESFVVVLSGGGSAVAPKGIALPSVQSLLELGLGEVGSGGGGGGGGGEGRTAPLSPQSPPSSSSSSSSQEQQ